MLMLILTFYIFLYFFSSLLCKSNTSNKGKNVIYLEYKQLIQIITPNKLELSGLYTWRSNNILNIYQKKSKINFLKILILCTYVVKPQFWNNFLK